MARHKVELTGVNTANIEVLTEEEQIELIKRMHEGDVFAKDRLINCNLRLVLSLLKRFSSRNENMDDLFQVGCVGLIKAIDNFNLDYEVKFSTYSVPMIVGEIKRYLRDSSPVRVSRSIKDMAFHALQKKEELTILNGKEPTVKEIAEAMNLPEFEVNLAIDSMKDAVSMFEPIYSDGNDTIYLSDQLESNENKEYDLHIKIAVKEAINKLIDKEKYVIFERFLVGKTQVELAKELGVSQAQISRLEKSGIDNIKRMVE